ncbi:hypothetical protein NQ317_010478 [Molorchus minor]|uniref:General transcription factor IIH subunit 4 n=1 Tax=Molorchus minor TaxID=1323400 RepID=A0ABQ9JZE9_9CUCU|nr:hypothetical protein NQ317_010478 [Molorchus minor]
MIKTSKQPAKIEECDRFYPTRLALNITNSQNKDTPDIEEDTPKGYIVVETNYRAYAYTDSNLQVALIGLFTELMYRFPNLVVGIITRDSVRQALRGGITADQIISYLKQHAHPQMLHAENKPPLPPTVVDQIKLWELERNRLTYNEGVLYSQFLSQADFNVLKEYAQSSGSLIWYNKERRTLVINKSAHDDVKKFWKRYSKGN